MNSEFNMAYPPLATLLSAGFFHFCGIDVSYEPTEVASHHQADQPASTAMVTPWTASESSLAR